MIEDEGGPLSTTIESRRISTIVVGASAGGIEALRNFVGALPERFEGVVLVVLHVAPGSTSVLPQILARAGPLDAKHAEDGAEARPGCIYVAPPDHHLLVADGHLRLDEGPRINGHRPAIDLLFQSAAAAYAAEVAGVILSGVLRDGTEGLLAIKRGGGMTFVQDPAEALYQPMPQNAIDAVQPDRIGTAHDLGVAIAEAVREPAGLS